MSLLFSVGYSQDKMQNITHYLFPEFTKGFFLMKTGVTNEALLNYNALTEEMIFEKSGVRLAVAQIEMIDTIFINKRKFFPVNGKFFELLYHSKYDLYVEHKCNIKDPGKPSGYGGSSQTSATNNYSSYFSGGRVYEMKLPDSVETNPYTICWLKKDGVLLKFYSIRQLSKFLGGNTSQFKNYVKENNVSYNDPESIVGLIRFLSKN